MTAKPTLAKKKMRQITRKQQCACDEHEVNRRVGKKNEDASEGQHDEGMASQEYVHNDDTCTHAGIPFDNQVANGIGGTCDGYREAEA